MLLRLINCRFIIIIVVVIIIIIRKQDYRIRAYRYRPLRRYGRPTQRKFSDKPKECGKFRCTVAYPLKQLLGNFFACS